MAQNRKAPPMGTPRSERPLAEQFRIIVQVQPGARRPGLAGWTEGVLRARVAAPATEGRANDALVALLAGALGVPRSAVRIIHEHGSRRKLVEVTGLDARDGEERLGKQQPRPR